MGGYHGKATPCFEKVDHSPSDFKPYPTLTDTYPPPRHGWTCFHCGVHFTADQAAQAREHFGATPSATPACKIGGQALAEIRRLEYERDEWEVRYNALQFGVDENDCVQRFRAGRGMDEG